MLTQITVKRKKAGIKHSSHESHNRRNEHKNFKL